MLLMPPRHGSVPGKDLKEKKLQTGKYDHEKVLEERYGGHITIENILTILT